MREGSLPITLLFLGLSLATAPADSAPPIKDGSTVTLEQAYDRTIATDQNILTAYIQIKRAHLDVLSAYTKVLPTVNGSVVSAWQSSANSGGIANSAAVVNSSSNLTSSTSTSSTNSVSSSSGTVSSFGGGSRDHYISGGVVLQQPLLDFSFFPARRLGLASQAGARFDYRQQIRIILIGVAQAYYNVLTSERVVEEDKLALKLAEEQHDLSAKQLNVGMVTDTDVLRAQVAVETAKQTLVTDANSLASQRNILSNTLNLPPDTKIRVVSPPDFPAKVPNFPSLLGRALALREDLRSKEEAIKHDTEARKEALAAYLPKISAQVEGFRTDQSSSSGRFSNEWQANVTLTIPIYNAGQREIDVKSATYQLEQTKLSRDSVAKTVEQDVKDAWLNVKTLTETLEAVRSQVAAADKAYKDLQLQYKTGISTSVDVLSALNDLNTARRSLAQQTFALQVALRKLDQVCGAFQETRVNQAPYPIR